MKSELWSYFGEPEYVALKLKPIYPSSDGGYVIFIELTDGQTWIYSSCNPGRCIGIWNNTARKFKLPSTKQVLVSQPFVMYTTVREKIIERLSPYRAEENGGFKCKMETIVKEAEIVMENASPAL